MTLNPLIQPAELAAHLDDPRWVIVDTRFYISEPDRGFQEYRAAHIPGARYSNLNQDLSAPRTAQSGRHPWPTLESFVEVIRRLGIELTSRVVVYDTSDCAMASRFWMLMNWFGFENCVVLDGGYAQWTRMNLSTSSEIPQIQKSDSPEPAQINAHLLVSTNEMEQIIRSPDFLLLDARSADRFRGENEVVDPVAGHIPGAKNRHYMSNMTESGVFKAPEQLRSEFIPLVSTYQLDHIVCYCGSGVTACHNILAMRIAGLPLPRLYAGSWSEWIRDPDHPIQTGE